MVRSLLFLAIVIGLLPIRPASAEELLIVGNASIELSSPLTLKQVAAIYLLRTTVWPDGSHIVPVNRESASEIRMRFTASVLNEDNANLTEYWNEMHFQGKLPPLVQESELAMLAFVQKVPGAIGYIHASTPALGVKVLAHVP